VIITIAMDTALDTKSVQFSLVWHFLAI